MASWTQSLHALALLLAANATPIVVAKVARDRAALALDFGRVMSDGERLLGAHKTWRGLVSGVLAGALVAALLELSPGLGAGFAALSLTADALSSCIKRRLRLKPGAEFRGFDQLGEALLPLAVFAPPLGLGVSDILLTAAVFVALDVAMAPLRHRRWF
jgi:CDP-archaeol synthase